MIYTVLTKEQYEELVDIATIYSDLYKDVYGMRPRGTYPATIHQYRKEVRKLSNQIKEDILHEQKLKMRKENRKPFISRPINYPFKDFYNERRN